MRAAQIIRGRDVHSTVLQHIVSNGAAGEWRYQSDQAQSLCRAIQPDSFGRSGTKSLNYHGLSSLSINGVSQRSWFYYVELGNEDGILDGGQMFGY
jgi:hypothetical protein